MKAIELIGKNAVRTQPIYEIVEGSYGYAMLGTGLQKKPNYAFTTRPIKILKATEDHIIYESEFMGKKSTTLLDSRYCDDKWTDYDELVRIE